MTHYQPDDDLLKRACNGEERAFELLAGEVYDTVYRFALKWSGDVHSAEDITQLAMIKLGQSIGQFRFEAKFSTWLYRLVTNTAIDWQRRQQKHAVSSLDSSDPVFLQSHSDSSSLEAASLLAQILTFISTLGDGLRETVLLVLGQGLSHKECAEVLGVAESTVSWRLHYVRKQLPQLGGIAEQPEPSRLAKDGFDSPRERGEPR